MEDLKFRKGDAKTDVFGSDRMLQPAPVEKNPGWSHHSGSSLPNGERRNICPNAAPTEPCNVCNNLYG